MSETTQLYKESISSSFRKRSTSAKTGKGVEGTKVQGPLKRNCDFSSEDAFATKIRNNKVTKKAGKREKLRVFFYGLFLLFVAFVLVIVDWTNGGLSSIVLDPALDYAFPLMNDPDRGRTIEQLVLSRGFEFEKHDVITEDGYMIEMHRIYHRKFANTTRRALLYGVPLFCSSAVAVLDYRNNSAGYLYADAGFDVWLTNQRGNRYGMRHVFLDPVKDGLSFFNFTIVDIGKFDMAAQIDYVIKATGQPKIYIAGVSQGGAAVFALLAKRPEYNEKIKALASFGGHRSLCWVTHALLIYGPLPIRLLADFSPYMSGVWTSLEPMNRVCARTGDACGILLTYTGFKSDFYLNVSRFGVYLDHVPAGTSFKNLFYYAQHHYEGCDGSAFEYNYDYGLVSSLMGKLGLRESVNVKRYGTPQPPRLNSDNIRIPIKHYYADGDEFVDEKESMALARDLGIPSMHLHRIADDRFSHLNFIYNKHRMDFIEHSIDFFNGKNSPWTGDYPVHKS